MRRLWWALAAVVVAASAGTLLVLRNHQDPDPSGTPAATGTAEVTRRDLAVTEEVTGDLGYADARDLTAYRPGVVTSLPDEGTTVKPGKALYSVNREKTVLLTGAVPAYRKLSTAATNGPDVKQLEKALKALGYGGDLTVDTDFTAATADAVEQWEDDLGREDPDGTVELGDVVFAPGPLRVTNQPVPIGGQVGQAMAVLSVSSTEKVANVDLDVDKSDLVAPKDTVTVGLPDGQDTRGKVASVGTEAQSNAADPGADPTVALVITLTRPADAKAFDSGSVTVTIERSREKDALAVPVTALLALAEGGYAVQVVDPARAGGYRLLGVKTGTITDSFAGISGSGVQEGLEVVVPR